MSTWRKVWRPVARWAAALVLAGVSVVLLCRALDVDGVTPLPQLLAFLPWLLVPGALAAALAALARWRTGLVWGAVVLAVTGWFCRPYGEAAEPEGRAVAQVRVLTSNIEFGGATEELLAAVRSEKPDLVFVQECDLGCSAVLKARLGERFPYRSLVEATGAEGSAILSRYPLKPGAGVDGMLGMPGAVAEVEGHSVRLQLAHPMPPVPGGVGLWRAELAGLEQWARGGPDQPTVLAGDFNASQDHAAFRRILDTGLRDSTRLAGGTRTPTWPASTASGAVALGTQIDHVLVSRDFTAENARFLDLPHTDHRSLVVDLTLHEPA
ncbi:endonuclease/exonuclease/phosphatase family protein [Streptomyces sp. B-S-A8]|uniref:Endonuclease/exonuclease/phosphatase family protein n=1 Tax=Streptomyces solicavernae TaxID=3043614 RepID=A0ABT6RLX3_9ACTN|nr:endonuclease/exonuclease/phosphatase family protein [Streptomyces sp. B-S-A8]MDI3384728.1 endonuclease/exonuclease/phosphatase family protein [Streptomyces sp. B-S-A8]